MPHRQRGLGRSLETDRAQTYLPCFARWCANPDPQWLLPAQGGVNKNRVGWGRNWLMVAVNVGLTQAELTYPSSRYKKSFYRIKKTKSKKKIVEH